MSEPPINIDDPVPLTYPQAVLQERNTKLEELVADLRKQCAAAEVSQVVCAKVQTHTLTGDMTSPQSQRESLSTELKKAQQELADHAKTMLEVKESAEAKVADAEHKVCPMGSRIWPRIWSRIWSRLRSRFWSPVSSSRRPHSFPPPLSARTTQMKLLAADISTERETYQQSRSGLDEIYHAMEKQLQTGLLRVASLQQPAGSGSLFVLNPAPTPPHPQSANCEKS